MEEKPKNSVPVEYELRMKDGTDFWVREASDYFLGKDSVHRTLAELTRRLETAGISYAIAGALALGQHGFVRMTTDIDLLVTRQGLDEFHSRFIGLGFVPAFPGARKKVRATESGVKIDFLVTGEFPGDGQPKPVAFPDPEKASFIANGMRFLTLEKLIELKLASGLSAPYRARDLADIQDLIRESHLQRDVAERLDTSVRSAYHDLWEKAQTPDVHNEG